MDTEQDRRVVVVTGASAGLGRATVRRFARDGAAIGLIARGEDGLEATASEVARAGGMPLVLSCDVADADAVDAAAERVERELGPIDLWINNAMTSVFAPVWRITAAEYARVTQVCYLGYVHGTLAALRRMRPRERGHVIQVGSALSHRAIPLQSAYCAAKAAVANFTESLRCELIHEASSIDLSIVHMPALNTPQFGWVRSRLPDKPQPVPPIFQPEVGATAIYHVARERPHEFWVGGSTVQALVGERVAPGWLDHLMAHRAWEGQMTDEPEDPDRPDNLFEPIPGDHGAHGDFDDRAAEQSWQLTLNRHKPAAALTIGGLAAAAAAAGVGVWALTRSDHSKAR